MIRAEITGNNRAAAVGLEVAGNAPVLMLCRKLIAAGHDPELPLEAYRGEVLCLRVRSIGEGARMTVRENEEEGPYFKKYTVFGGTKDTVGVSHQLVA